MNTSHTGFRPEEQPLTVGTEFLHEVQEQDDMYSPVSTAIGSPAASIKLDSAPAPTPLPMGKFSILLMLNAVCPLAFELIYPFINAMIVEIGVTDDPERVGFYSGLVESVFSLMGFIMILPCGFLSDRFGRKPVILLGFAGLAVSMTCFGLSKSLAGMISSRCIGGALGASWAAIKVMTGEMTDRSNQDLAFSLLQITYRLGQIIGLPLGGLLAHPEERFEWFRTAFWTEYPYLLPCLVGSAFAIASVIPGIVFIEETLPSKRKQRRKINRRTASYGSTDSSVSSTSTLVPEEGFAQSPVDLESTEKKDKPQVSWWAVLTPRILSILLSNAFMCFSSEMIFSIFPLFAYTPVVSGGLGMSEAEIGTQMAIRSVSTVVLMASYSKFIGNFNTMTVYKFSMALWPVTIICFPLLNWIVRTQAEGTESFIFLASLNLFYIIWSLGGFCWICTASMVNDAAPSAEALSVVTGLSQMGLILPQAIAPALGNSLFAASIYDNIMGGNLIWVVLLAMTTIAWLHSLTLRAATHDWRENVERDDDDE